MAADGFGAGRGLDLADVGGDRTGQSQNGAGRPSLAKAGERLPGRFAAGDDDGRHRCPCRGLEGRLPACVDLDDVEKSPHHPIHAGQQLRSGRSPGFVERLLQGVGSGHRSMKLLFGLTERLFGRFQPGRGQSVGRFHFGHDGLQAMTGLLGFGQSCGQLPIFVFQKGAASFGRHQPGGQLLESAPVPLEGPFERTELAAGHGDRFLGLSERSAVPPGVEMGLECSRRLGLPLDQGILFGGEPGRLGFRRRQLLAQMSGLRLECRHHIGIGRSVEGLSQRAAALPQHPDQAPGPLDQSFGPAEGGGQIGLPLGRHLVAGALGIGVKLVE